MALLSIVTPTFQYGRFLPALLDSVEALEVDHEHLIVDGGSTDGTVELLRGRESERLRWKSAPDRGQNDAVNQALGRLAGDYVNWINADNVYLPGAIDRAVALLEERPEVDAVFGGIEIIDEQGVARRRYVPAPWSWRRYLFVGDYVPTETIVFRRSLLDAVPQLDEDAGDAADYDFYLRLLHRRRVERIAEPLIAYRHHEAAKTTSDPFEGQRRALEVRQRWARNEGDRALMESIDAAKRAVLPLVSPWPEPY